MVWNVDGLERAIFAKCPAVPLGPNREIQTAVLQQIIGRGRRTVFCQIGRCSGNHPRTQRQRPADQRQLGRSATVDRDVDALLDEVAAIGADDELQPQLRMSFHQRR